MTVKTPAVEYYYDLHPTEEDLMGYSELQSDFVEYLGPVLKWLFREEGWFIPQELNLYMTDDPKERPVVPDIAVFKGVVRPADSDDYLKSWRVRPPDQPPPAIVFEVASDDTWQKDLEEKPEIYARMGVREYVYFDGRPRRPRRSPKLKVWRNQDRKAVELPSNGRGWVWSEELESWLVPDRKLLRLYDRSSQRRLTGEEAERRAKERAWEALRRLGVDPETL